MDEVFEKEISRVHVQHLIDSKPDIAREYTIPDLLHKIDPSLNIDPLAEELLLDIADDFIDTLVLRSAECAKKRESKEMQDIDVSFVLKELFGDSLMEESESMQQVEATPSESYTKKLEAINQARHSQAPSSSSNVHYTRQSQ